MFNNKVLLITGGTGSFGNAVASRFLDLDLRIVACSKNNINLS